MSAAERAVRGTVRRYLAAVRAGRAAAACRQLTAASRERLADAGRHALGIRHASCAATIARTLRSAAGRRLRRLARSPIHRVVIHGSRARAYVTGLGAITVVRQGSRWLIVGRPAIESD